MLRKDCRVSAQRHERRAHSYHHLVYSNSTRSSIQDSHSASSSTASSPSLETFSSSKIANTSSPGTSETKRSESYTSGTHQTTHGIGEQIMAGLGQSISYTLHSSNYTQISSPTSLKIQGTTERIGGSSQARLNSTSSYFNHSATVSAGDVVTIPLVTAQPSLGMGNWNATQQNSSDILRTNGTGKLLSVI